jgi:hypothetical protein
MSQRPGTGAVPLWRNWGFAAAANWSGGVKGFFEASEIKAKLALGY